ncbi:MAG: hypothetical protein K2K44_08905, partial [Oscillospiraceae bacterium]|nr:hypothetical protein [Oscillospiraceae bacterium]
LLCSSSAYGLAMAAGICIVWLVEEWNGKNIFKFISEFIRTKAFLCLLGLLIFAVILLLCIMPYDDTHAINSGSTARSTKKVLCNLFYTFFILPYDTTVGAFLSDDTVGITYIFKPYILLYIPLSAIIAGIMYLFGKKHRCTSLLLIQFVEIPILFALVRMSAHHVGIVTLFMIFWICVCFDTGHTESYGKYDTVIHCIFTFSACIFILVQISWSVISSAADIKYNYSTGKAMAEYIKDNDLENTSIMSSWLAVDKNEDSEEKYYLFNSSSTGTEILPYFDSNIFPNFNWGRADMGYNEHRDILDENEYKQMLERFRQLDSPEYIFGTLEFGDDDLDNIFSNNTFSPYFYVVDNVEYCMVFKGNYSKEYAPIYKFADIENVLKKEVPENEGTD